MVKLAVIFIRTIIIFISILFFMRLLGKRQMGELELSELVVSVLIADLASLPLEDIGIPMINGIIPIIILFCCELIVADLTMKSVKLRAVLCGKPCILVENGIILQREMEKCRFTADELLQELRSKSISDISQVKYAILETNGTLSTILKSQFQPATAAQLEIKTTDPSYPVVIIDEGRLLSDNLKKAGYDEKWLEKTLRKNGAKSVRDVYLLIADSEKTFYAAKDKYNA